MNLTDLHTELRQQADDRPDLAALRTDVLRRSDSSLRHRRTVALISAATVVVLLVGGVGIAAAALKHDTSRPAGPHTVVPVPNVPLPADTTLIRHQLAEVVSPVNAPAPQGMDGSGWIETSGRLAVSYGITSDGAVTVTSSDGPGPPSAGYVITDAPDEDLTVVGPMTGQDTSGQRPATATSTPTTIGGHPAQLEIAPQGALDAWGYPAERRLVWQLGNGRWIHVWAQSAEDPHLLESFAASITERPTPLPRSIGIGVTLPGLTEDSSINLSVLDSNSINAVYLCPAGTKPFAAATSSAGSEPTPEPGTSASPGATPTDPASPMATAGSAPYASCLIASIIDSPGGRFEPGDPVWATGPAESPTTVTVGTTTVQVNDAGQTAWADLGNGMIAIVGAPEHAALSADELAAVVSSVRSSSDVRILPAITDAPGGAPIATVVTDMPSSAKAVPPRSSGPSASTDPRSSAASTASQAPDNAAAQVLAQYLSAVRQGDCAAAARLYVGEFGDLCGALTLSDYTIGGAAAVNTREFDFSTTLVTSGSADGTIPAGSVTWFFTLEQQPDGTWRITGAGSGP